MTKTTETVPVSCNLDCGGACSLIAHVKDGHIEKITNNPASGPYMRGCVKGFRMAKVVYAPDRLKRPLLRTGAKGSGEFKEVEWDEALDFVAGKLEYIKEEYGNEAIFNFGSSGSVIGLLHNTFRLTSRFLNLFGGHILPLGTYSAQAATYSVMMTIGDMRAGSDPGTLEHSKLIILWGANIYACRFGSEFERRIKEARDRGVEVIVIDPRRSESVTKLGTEWIPIKPGTDSALMMAVLYILVKEGMADYNFLNRYCKGFKDLEEHLLGEDGTDPKTPAWAEGICGVREEKIIELAKKYANKKPAALLPGFSIQRTMGGEEPARLAIVLQAATGNFGVIGGSSGGPLIVKKPKVGRMSTFKNPVGRFIPLIKWPDAILEGKEGGFPADIKAVYAVGNNYLNQGPDISKNIRAFKKLELAVCHDRFLTPTARYSDIILPATTFLERNDIIVPWATGNFILFSNKAIDPITEARNDYDIFAGISERLGFAEKFTENKSEDEWFEEFLKRSPMIELEEFRKKGIFFGEDQKRAAFSRFIESPKANRLKTPSGLIEIHSKRYATSGFPAIPTCRVLENDEMHPLFLVTPKSRFRVHSQNSNIDWFREKETQSIWINPVDAISRGIKDNDLVQVRSRNGRSQIRAYVTEDIMPGVVSLNEGMWFSFDGDDTDTAGSANVLTSSIPTLPSMGPCTHTVQVQIDQALPK
ncbi:MAG: molybdopterin-dependent oxidoreductase [Halobacteriota archaeon]|nr:molybdopterin-dependent oxidoreductase [Halobacteriota archaeon]